MQKICQKRSYYNLSAKQIQRFGRGLRWLACVISFGQNRPFLIMIWPPMELVKKGVLRKSDRWGMEQRKKWRVELLLGTWKTLYQHWRQFTPQFSGGPSTDQSGRGRWGGFVTDTTPVSSQTGGGVVYTLFYLILPLQYCFQEQGGCWQGGRMEGEETRV